MMVIIPYIWDLNPNFEAMDMVTKG